MRIEKFPMPRARAVIPERSYAVRRLAAGLWRIRSGEQLLRTMLPPFKGVLNGDLRRILTPSAGWVIRSAGAGRGIPGAAGGS